MRKAASPAVSEACFQATSRAHCSLCDADVGTGLADEMCESFCSQWMYACMNDFVDPYIDATEQVPFCQSDSMVCSPVAAVVNTPEAFCKMMGFNM